MTDIWCFTCRHEIRENFIGGYAHVDRADALDCVCVDDEEECAP